MFYINQNLVELNRVFDQNKREGYLRLDLNENPEGLPEEFIKDVLSGVTPEMISQYPETLEFTEFLARRLNTDISHISLTNGSSEAIRNIIEAFTSPSGKIVGVAPSYAMFEVYSKMYGRNFVPVEYADDLTLDVGSIASVMDDEVQLLILVNPNNPMGNVYTSQEIEFLLSEADRHNTVVLVDEAYHYFCPETAMEHALSRERVFVTRTFSKLFSLAGARLGYVVGWPEGVEIVQKLNTPHNVNMFAMLFAKAILEKEGMLECLISSQAEGKAYLAAWLEGHGYSYKDSGGNFMFINPHGCAEEIVRRMKSEKGILIKKYEGIGIFGSCLRVTTGPKSSMRRFTDALGELDMCGAE